MEQCYRHFDHKERTLIYWWRKENLSLREIGRRLRRSHTSVSRELRRNRWCSQGYFPRGAQILAAARLRRRAKRDRLKSKQVRVYVHEKLSIGWTPELIAGRLKHQDQLPTVCHESIYQYIYCRAQHLISALPRHHRKRRPKRPYRKTGERIKNRTAIEQRPQAANTRRAYGHWEADMIVAGDRQHGLNVLVERKSRLTHISILKNKTAAATKQVMCRRLNAYPASLTQSITYDNGSENTCHEELNEALGTTSFFCAPYHSWEKGSVEQVNGLIRRFLPKGTNFHELGHGEINRIEKLLNHRPRKCLNYRTPYEVFREARGALDV
jgi:IS30 family transposase